MSFAVQRHWLASKRPDGIAADLLGSGTSWSGATNFTLSGVAGCSIPTTVVLSATSARLVIATGAATGTLTIGDGTSTATVQVRSAPPGRKWFPMSR